MHRPAGPSEVILTGNFDNWSQSLPLVKTSKGDFELTLPLDGAEEKIVFKFVVDGEWKASDEYDIDHSEGAENNVVYLKNVKAQEEGATGSKIPESGGLIAAGTAAVSGLAAAGAAAVFGTSSSEENAPSTTVLPSNEGKQETSATGEPGIVIPQNPHEIKEFNEVSDVNAKELNEKLNAPDVSTTVLPSSEGVQDTGATGEAGIAVPKDAADIKEFNEVSDVNAKDLNAKLNGVPTTEGVVIPENPADIKEFSEVSDVDAKGLNTKTRKVKKIIKRNKVTGEETVVSSEPYEEESAKTLDPKAAPSDETPVLKEPTKTKADEKASTTTAAEAEAASKEATKPKTEAKKTKTVPAKKEEEKKKGGFFRKLKKLL